jgi:deoxycytidine triphosphate deaminase
MLGFDAVLAEIRSGKIRLTYAFDPDQFSIIVPKDGVATGNDPPETRGDEILRANLFGDRLGLSLGPVVYSHSYAARADRTNFRALEHNFDLRDNANAITILPGESLVISTLERIALDGQLAATVLPRLTLATAGLLLAPSYVDPHWDGILLLHLHNVSSKSYTLRVGERIGICRFHRLEGHVTHTPQDFAAKSHHYGITWEMVLRGEKLPYPFKKTPQPSVSMAQRVRTWWSWANEARQLLGGATLLGLCALALIQYGRMSYQIEHLDGVVSGVPALEQSVDDLHREQADARSRGALSGIESVAFPVGVHSVSTLVPLDSSAGDRHVVIALPAMSGLIRTSAHLETRLGQRVLVLDSELISPDAPFPTTADVYWLLP